MVDSGPGWAVAVQGGAITHVHPVPAPCPTSPRLPMCPHLGPGWSSTDDHGLQSCHGTGRAGCTQDWPGVLTHLCGASAGSPGPLLSQWEAIWVSRHVSPGVS